MQDYPLFNYGGAATSFNLANNTSALVALFYLPFHLSLANVLLQFSSVPTPVPVAVAVYNESGSQRLWHGTLPAPAAAGALQVVPADIEVTLPPGAYWLAIVPTGSPVSLAIRSYAQPTNITFTRPASDGYPPYAGSYVVAVPGALDPTLVPANLVSATNGTVMARLVSS